MQDIRTGYLVRFAHSNGARLLFLLLFTHTSRGLYYKSYKKTNTWYTGSTALLITIGVSFIGYVLPNNQMSYWGCIVITSILTEVPLIGENLVTVIWGGLEINHFTINRLFALHFFLPLIAIIILISHILALHTSGSRNPTGLSSSNYKAYFLSFSLIKDIWAMSLIGTLFLILVLLKPLIMGDHDNFSIANKIDTPHHIQPEWYFLFAYAILRSVPSKAGGVIALVISVIVIIILPKVAPTPKAKSLLYRNIFWLFVGSFVTLTFLGSKPVEPPYPLIANVITIIYFSFFIFAPKL